MNSPPSIGKSIATGAGWTISLRWFMRLIGVANTFVLARLLDPADFGIIAMSMILINLLDSLGDVNVDTALVRNSKDAIKYFDSAWTAQIIVGLLKAAIVFALAPHVADFYGDERIEIVLYLLALWPLLLGFENIGQVQFRLDLDFRRDFKYALIRRLAVFFFTIGMAVYLQNFYAIVYSYIFEGIFVIFLSFVMAKYRPKISFRDFGYFFSFSKWWLGINLNRFIVVRSEEFLLGRLFDASLVGGYFVSKEASALPTREVAVPATRVLIPTLARIEDPQAQSFEFLRSFQFIALYVIPAAVGLHYVSEEFVTILLGTKWLEYVPLFELLALNGGISALMSCLMPLVIVQKRERLWYFFTLFQALIIVVLLAQLLQGLSIDLFLLLKVLATCLFLTVGFLLHIRRRVFSFSQVFLVVYRALFAAICMALVLELFGSDHPFWFGLLGKLALGGGSYALVVYALWRLAKRPEGAEAIIFGMVTQLVAKLFRKVSLGGRSGGI